MDHLQAERAVVGGTGMGGTIALRAGLYHPERIDALIVVSIEGRDRAFRTVDDLGDITAPTLIFPGGDARHPPQTPQLAASVLPNGRVASVGVSAELRTAEDLASAVAPSIRRFLAVLDPASQP